MILVDNTFDKGPEGWCSYDYHRSMVDGGENYFVLTVHRPKGGVNDSGYVWTEIPAGLPTRRKSPCRSCR